MCRYIHIIIIQFGAVFLAVSGITLFAFVDGFESANIVGVVLSVGAALGAALYKVSFVKLYAMTPR